MSPAAPGGLVSEFFCCGLPSVLLQLLTPVFCHTDTDAPGECMDSERASVHAPAKGSLAPTDIGYKLSKQVRRPGLLFLCPKQRAGVHCHIITRP